MYKSVDKYKRCVHRALDGGGASSDIYFLLIIKWNNHFKKLEEWYSVLFLFTELARVSSDIQCYFALTLVRIFVHHPEFSIS